MSEYWYNGLGYLITRHQDTDTDGDVDGSDKKYHTAFDERWRPIATFRDSDTDPKEQFLYHAAGAGGFGRSSYIDLVVMRDRDANSGWTSAADGTLEERIYVCQNWRADVVALVGVDGGMKEWAKYSAYGIPFGMPWGDSDSDGDCDSADDTQVTTWKNSGPYDVRGDTNLDGDVDVYDETAVQGGHQSLGRGVLTASGVGNRKGHTGSENDAKIGAKAHVRHRVIDERLGYWLSRDRIERADTRSLYWYLDDRPLNTVDYDGLQANPNPFIPAVGQNPFNPHPVPRPAQPLSPLGPTPEEASRRSAICGAMPGIPPTAANCIVYGNSEFKGRKQACMCMCMGDDPIHNRVRGCLLCMFLSGADAQSAHDDCFSMLGYFPYTDPLFLECVLFTCNN